MHLQIRVSLSAGGQGGPGAEPALDVQADGRAIRPGALAQFCREVATAGINLRAAGGEHIESGGLFSFAVDDADEDRLIGLLDRLGHRYSVVAVEDAHLKDEPGSLARFAQGLAERGLLIESLLLGTPEPDGTVPLQARTLRPASLG